MQVSIAKLYKARRSNAWAATLLIFFTACLISVGDARAQGQERNIFDPLYEPAQFKACAPSFICLNFWRLNTCRDQADMVFGSNKYYLYATGREDWSLTAILALAGHAAAERRQRGCPLQDGGANSNFGATVQRRFVEFSAPGYESFLRGIPDAFWENEARQAYFYQQYQLLQDHENFRRQIETLKGMLRKCGYNWNTNPVTTPTPNPTATRTPTPRQTPTPRPSETPRPTNTPTPTPNGPGPCSGESPHKNRQDPGDVDQNGCVGTNDARVLQNWRDTRPSNLCGIPPEDKKRVDLNVDWQVTQADTQEMTERLVEAQFAGTDCENGGGTTPTPTPTPATFLAKITAYGSGRITSSNATVDCRPKQDNDPETTNECTFTARVGQTYELRAVPDEDWWFTYWESGGQRSFLNPLTLVANTNLQNGKVYFATYEGDETNTPTPTPGSTNTPGSPTPTPSPTTTARPTSSPTPTFTATPIPPTSTPTPASSGNVIALGESGRILNSLPARTGLTGCGLTTGRCATDMEPNTRAVLNFAPTDERGRALAEIVCRQNDSVSQAFTNPRIQITVPRIGAIRCTARYAEGNFRKVSVRGLDSVGAPAVSNPAGVIDCNGTNRGKCTGLVPEGSRLSVTFPALFEYASSIAEPQPFCQFRCVGQDTGQQIFGSRGERTFSLESVSQDWVCTGSYKTDCL